MSEEKKEYKVKKYTDALDNLLDRPIAFNPSFKKVTGSTNAALLLSQAFYWTKRTSNQDGWFYKTRADWMDETGLTEAELDGAREKCKAVGVIEEKLKGVPATVHYRIVKSKVYELLGFQIPTFPESGFQPNSQIPTIPESGSYGDFNKESESTTVIINNKEENFKILRRLYEENVCGLVPLMIPKLQDAAAKFPPEWYEPAFSIMVAKTPQSRNWNFVYTVMENWLKNGRDWSPAKPTGQRAGYQKPNRRPSDEKPDQYDYDALRAQVAAAEAKRTGAAQ